MPYELLYRATEPQEGHSVYRDSTGRILLANWSKESPEDEACGPLVVLNAHRMPLSLKHTSLYADATVTDNTGRTRHITTSVATALVLKTHANATFFSTFELSELLNEYRSLIGPDT